MSSGIIQFLALELHNSPTSSRRLEIIHALGLLICLPTEQAQPPLLLQILLTDLITEPTYLCFGLELLQVIARVSLHLDSIDGPLLIHKLSVAWPQLFHWMWIHASLLDIPSNTAAKSRKSQYFSATVDILSLYSGHPALLRISSQTETTPTMFLTTRMWYLKAKGLESSIPASITSLCRTYIKSSTHTPDERCVNLGFVATLPSITADLGTGIQNIGSMNAGIASSIGLLLRAPSAELATLSPDINSVESHLDMIVMFSRAPRHTYAFITNHSPLILANVLVSLSNLSTAASDMPLIAHGAGFEPVLEALGAMLLPALITCYARITHLNSFVATEHDAASLICILSKYLIFISARERVSKSLEIIAENGFEDLLVPNTSFAVAWSNFKMLAVQRMKVQERPVRLKNEIMCSNIKTYDWKSGGHKTSCVNPYPDRRNFPISNRDLRSADEVVRHDLKLKLPEIRAAWNTPAAPVIIFDYTKPTLHFTTTSTASHQPRHTHISKKQDMFWKETLEMVDGARKRGVDQGLIVIDIPGGATPYSTSVMITLAELEATITSSGPLFGPEATLCVG
ncbi:hypothetical protein C8R44DRAFT_897542 [Mycena epipterygia]|nr:hypothetical protein C8R44DRAFT_897542 [Mycena epipterygia]